jgi:hypothetical protein
MDSGGAQNCDFRAVVTAVEVRGECDRARRSFGDSGDAGVRFRPRVGLRVGDLVPAESGSALCELTRTEDENPELGASLLHELQWNRFCARRSGMVCHASRAIDPVLLQTTYLCSGLASDLLPGPAGTWMPPGRV